MRTIGILGGLALAALGLPAPASAACGGAERFWPVNDRNEGRPPLAIGDSIMLGAIEPIQRSGFELDVRGCRPFSEGLSVMRSRKRSHLLPDIVVLGLGTNWTVTTSQIRTALRIAGPRRVLGLVTPRETGGVASSDQRAIREAGQRWPRRVKVLDWVAYSARHSNWFWSDGLHLQPRGARALARLMRQAFTWELPGTDAETEPIGGDGGGVGSGGT